jgi:glycosyltransferase involved in cell wall biosynthesis
MANKTEHICVCICTYKRPELLQRLLESLKNQVTDDLFTYSVVVVDNDRQQSAEAVVSYFAASCQVPILYCVEPEQSIPKARNRAVANAVGDLIAFIDDDEFARRDWLLNLLRAFHQYSSDGVVGPVIRHFEEEPPKWILKGNFWQRAVHATGMKIKGIQGRLGNALLKGKIFAGRQEPFRPEYRAGEDWDFFTRMIEAGYTFVWCQEAAVYEVVPPMRWKRSFILKRSLLQGSVNTLHRTFGEAKIGRSLLALPAYAALLPFAIFLGHYMLMKLLVKLVWHLGKVLAFFGIQVIKSPYVTS